MSQVVAAALRTAVQSGWGWLVAQIPLLAVLPADKAVEFITTFVVIAGITYGLRWLETREGEGFWPSLARKVAQLAMLGLSKTQPVYRKQLTADELAAADAAKKARAATLLKLIAEFRTKDLS